MSGEEEYEIESILEACVEKKKGRSGKLVWKYRVRWKGYTAGDDTWEPIESFTGAEESIARFWERANTGGRDYRDLSQFKAGESFVPVGPPRKRKAKGKETADIRRSPKVSSDSVLDPNKTTFQNTLKRTHDDTDAEDDHSPKRPRPTESFGSKPSLLLTDESPRKRAIDDNDINNTLPTPTTSHPSPEVGMRSTFTDTVAASDEEREVHEDLLTPELQLDERKEGSTPATQATRSTENGQGNPSSSQTKKDTMPLHRARVANPLVKILDDHHKASLQTHRPEGRLESPKQGSSSVKRQKPGPGRSSDGLIGRPSSLLTAEKGKAKILKPTERFEGRTRRHMISAVVEDVPPVETIQQSIEQEVLMQAPKAEELLQLAGLRGHSPRLSDYDDDGMSKEITSAQEEVTQEITQSNAQNMENDQGSLESHTLLTVRDSLFPSTSMQTVSKTGWRHSTIFGPLTTGSATEFEIKEQTSGSSTNFQINLDSSTSIPVFLVDATNSNTPSASQKDPPGKFYRGQFAIQLLATLRTNGSSARVRLSPEATNDDATNFDHFAKRLASDELFLTMAGKETVVFCSSMNALFSQRLNIPANLLVVDGPIASQVSIEDYSAFADATVNADDTVWSQYIQNIGN